MNSSASMHKPDGPQSALLSTGVWPVMLTPLQDNKTIDWSGLDALIEWYLQAGVAGLFAVCLSSEMYQLTDDERLALARHVVQRGQGRVPVVAAATFDPSLERKIEFVRMMQETGVTAVVVITSQMAADDETDEVWCANVQRLLDDTGTIPLGAYECPLPYRRGLTPETMQWLAQSGRFLFFKDTCAQLATITTKLAAVQGSPLHIYNAHTPTLLDSLQAGGHGYSGIAANFYPELCVWMCQNFQTQPERAQRLQRFFSVTNELLRYKYPVSAKAYLRLRGLPSQPFCRVRDDTLTTDDLRIFRHLLELMQEFVAFG